MVRRTPLFILLQIWSRSKAYVWARAVRGFTSVHNDGARRSRGEWVDSGSPWQRRGAIGGSHVLGASFYDGRGGRVCITMTREPFIQCGK